jgi:hypothetical protein
VNYDTNLGTVWITNTAAVSSNQRSEPAGDSVAVRVNPVDSDGDGITDPYDSEPLNPNMPSTYPPRVYITTEDNEDNEGSGSPDNDVSQKVYRDDPRTPIEFNIWVDETLMRRCQLKTRYWQCCVMTSIGPTNSTKYT